MSFMCLAIFELLLLLLFGDPGKSREGEVGALVLPFLKPLFKLFPLLKKEARVEPVFFVMTWLAASPILGR